MRVLRIRYKRKDKNAGLVNVINVTYSLNFVEEGLFAFAQLKLASLKYTSLEIQQTLSISSFRLQFQSVTTFSLM